MSNLHDTTAIPANRDFSLTNGMLQIALGLVALVMMWHCRAWQRNRLAMLDDRLLTDMGISREKAAEEANKPFWRR